MKPLRKVMMFGLRSNKLLIFKNYDIFACRHSFRGGTIPGLIKSSDDQSFSPKF